MQMLFNEILNPNSPPVEIIMCDAGVMITKITSKANYQRRHLCSRLKKTPEDRRHLPQKEEKKERRDVSR